MMAVDVRRPRFRHWRIAGPILLLAIAAIHVVEYPDHAEAAPYLGVLFLLNAAVALVLGAGIVQGNRWAWPVATAFSALTLGMYVVARTSGLPSYKSDDWLEFPFGLLSLVVEGAFIVAYVWLRLRQSRRATRRDYGVPPRAVGARGG